MLSLELLKVSIIKNKVTRSKMEDINTDFNREIDLKRNILKIDSTVWCKCSFFNIHVDIIKFFQGVLLYGPPGTGKTLLARAVAHHTECTFIRVSGSELVQKFIGEGARMVRELFVMARYSNNNLI